MRRIRGFGAFWYDFIVGDSKILAVGGPAVLLVAYLTVRGGVPTLGEALIPLGVVGTLALSLRQAAK